MRLAVAVALGAFVLAGCGADDEPTSRPTPTPTPTSYAVDGHALWGECTKGEGPYVVYLHGLGGSSSDLADLAETVSAAAPDQGSCRYDRVNAGRSESDPAEQPLTASVEELAAFLDQAGVDAPVVLVAHSYGGLIATAFAGEYAERVAGLVLVDAVLPSDLELLNADMRSSIQVISDNNREHVDVMAAYETAAEAELPDVPYVYVDATQEDLPTQWGARGYRAALTRYVEAQPQGRLVETDTDHLSVLDSPELAEAVVSLLG